MGIPRFFREIILSRHKQNAASYSILQSNLPSDVASALFDFNGILHAVAQENWSYYDGYNEQRAQRILTMSAAQLEQDYFNILATKLHQIFGLIRPRAALVIAIDGPAPIAKINQQRQRRYKEVPGAPFVNAAGKTIYPPNLKIFDPNSITPGTDFMIKIDTFIQKWIVENQLILPPKVIYSSHLVAGEGEHKIFNLIREGYLDNDHGAHVLYGLDADLIILSLLAPLNNIFLMREDINSIINIDNLKDSINKELKTPTAINDFALMSFFLGNDFLPPPPSLTDLGYAFESLLEVYKTIRTAEPSFGLVTPHGFEIDLENLTYFLETVASVEDQLLFREIERLGLTAPETLRRSLVEENGQPKVDINTYRTLWYTKVLGSPTPLAPTVPGVVRQIYQPTLERIAAMSNAYLTSIFWIYSYYLGDKVNIYYYYPFHYAPLIQDLAAVAADPTIGPYLASGDQEPINPIYQLLMVLPPRSANLLPVEVRHLVESFSDISDLYPVRYIIDPEGAHNGTSLLPFPDLNRVQMAVYQTAVITPERLNRYQLGSNVYMLRNPEIQRMMEQKREVDRLLAPSSRGRGRGSYRGDRGGYSPREFSSSRGIQRGGVQRGGVQRGGFERGRGGSQRNVTSPTAPVRGQATTPMEQNKQTEWMSKKYLN